MSPAEVRYREGLACLARRDFAAARTQLEEATRLASSQPAAWLALGIAQRELEDLPAAKASLERALAGDPRIPQARGQLGLVLQALGRLPEAIDHLVEEARRFPQAPRNHNNLGMALLAAGRADEARDAFLRAVSLDRNYLNAHANIAALFHRQGRLPEAEAAYRQVIRLAPSDAAAHSRLGHILTAMWRPGEAEPFLRRAMALDPADPAPPRTLAYVLRRLNRVDEARSLASEILRHSPGDLQAAIVEGLSLPSVYASKEALLAARERYAASLDRLVSETGRFAAEPAQVLALAWENFHLAYQGLDDRALQEKYAGLLAGLAARAAPQYFAPRPQRTRAPGERIRVGFLSSFFRDSTAGKYFRSWVTDLDRSRFEVFVYYTGHIKDALGDAIIGCVEHYRHILDSVPRVAELVIADRLDILVYPEVGMDVSNYLLAGMRLAPVQCAGWGHPVTTGQAAIDWFITCGEMEPEGAEAHYREPLVRLPGIGTRYARPGPASAKSWRELGLSGNGHRYLCPQSLFKIHPDNDALFARVLASDPEGVLVLFRDHDEPLTEAYRRRLFVALAEAGVDGPARTVFLGRLDHADYLRANALCDVVLDTLHWSGGNTSLDAIAAGLPVVTLPGRFMRGRQSLAMLRRMGLGELVANDESDYVRIAVRAATDAEWRAGIRARMQAGAARIFDDPAPVAALQDFLARVAGPAAQS